MLTCGEVTKNHQTKRQVNLLHGAINSGLIGQCQTGAWEIILNSHDESPFLATLVLMRLQRSLGENHLAATANMQMTAPYSNSSTRLDRAGPWHFAESHGHESIHTDFSNETMLIRVLYHSSPENQCIR